MNASLAAQSSLRIGSPWPLKSDSLLRIEPHFFMLLLSSRPVGLQAFVLKTLSQLPSFELYYGCMMNYGHMKTRTPQTITKPILQLCEEINKDQKPYFVRVNPEPYSQTQDCFENVRLKIKKDGGELKYGWTIWETPDIFIEAEFHGIWLSPKNEEIDITPYPISIRKILFLADDTRKYEGKRVDNIRRSISENPLVPQFIKACEEVVEFEEKVSPGPVLLLEGEELAYHEALKRRQCELYMQIVAQNTPPVVPVVHSPPRMNDPCPCGSGKKYKRCCGRNS